MATGGAEDPAALEMHHTISRVYPVPGGILKTIPSEKRARYKSVAVDGLDIREHHITGYILEMSSCVNSCVGGPGMKEHSTPFLMSKDAVYTFSRKDNGGEMPPSEKVQVGPRR